MFSPTERFSYRYVFLSFIYSFFLFAFVAVFAAAAPPVVTCVANNASIPATVTSATGSVDAFQCIATSTTVVSVGLWSTPGTFFLFRNGSLAGPAHYIHILGAASEAAALSLPPAVVVVAYSQLTNNGALKIEGAFPNGTAIGIFGNRVVAAGIASPAFGAAISSVALILLKVLLLSDVHLTITDNYFEALNTYPTFGHPWACLLNWVVASGPRAVFALDRNTLFVDKSAVSDFSSVLFTIQEDFYLAGSSVGPYTAGLHALGPNTSVSFSRNVLTMLGPSPGINAVHGAFFQAVQATGSNSTANISGNTISVPASFSIPANHQNKLALTVGNVLVGGDCHSRLLVTHNAITVDTGTTTLDPRGISLFRVNFSAGGATIDVSHNRVTLIGSAAIGRAMTVSGADLRHGSLFFITDNTFVTTNLNQINAAIEVIGGTSNPFSIRDGAQLIVARNRLAAPAQMVSSPLLFAVTGAAVSTSGHPTDVQLLANRYYNETLVATPSIIAAAYSLGSVASDPVTVAASDEGLFIRRALGTCRTTASLSVGLSLSNKTISRSWSRVRTPSASSRLTTSTSITFSGLLRSHTSTVTTVTPVATPSMMLTPTPSTRVSQTAPPRVTTTRTLPVATTTTTSTSALGTTTGAASTASSTAATTATATESTTTTADVTTTTTTTTTTAATTTTESTTTSATSTTPTTTTITVPADTLPTTTAANHWPTTTTLNCPKTQIVLGTTAVLVDGHASLRWTLPLAVKPVFPQTTGGVNNLLTFTCGDDSNATTSVMLASCTTAVSERVNFVCALRASAMPAVGARCQATIHSSLATGTSINNCSLERIMLGFVLLAHTSEGGLSIEASVVVMLAAAVVASVISALLLGDPTDVAVVITAMLLSGPCGVDGDAAPVRIMQYVISPLHWLGPSVSASVYSASVAVVTLAWGVVCIVYGHVSKADDRSLTTSSLLARLRFPSVPFAMASGLYGAVAWEAGRMVTGGGGPDSQWGLGPAGLFLLFVPAAHTALVTWWEPGVYCPVSSPSVSSFASTDEPHRGWSLLWRKLILPRGFWSPTASERALGLVRGLAGPRGWLLLSGLCALVVAASVLVHSGSQQRSASCVGRCTTLTVLCVLAAALIVLLRPYRTHATTALTVMGLLMSAITAAVAASTGAADRNHRSACRDDLLAATVIVLSVCSIVRCFHALRIRFWWERRYPTINAPPPFDLDHHASLISPPASSRTHSAAKQDSHPHNTDNAQRTHRTMFSTRHEEDIEMSSS